MENPAEKIADFVKYVKTYLTGDEKGEAHLFCDNLFKAFGHEGLKQAGATLEFRVHPEDKKTKYVDLLWPGRLLLEMKKVGEKLEKHRRQVFDYWWTLVPNRPQYTVLCNFNEFWVYDLNKQINEPMDTVRLDDLPARYTTLGFLFPTPQEPVFKNNLVKVTRETADKVAGAFNLMIKRKNDPVPREVAQRFILQSVVAMFAQSIGLLPNAIFVRLLEKSSASKGSSYDLLGGLFRQMASPKPASGGDYKDVNYFNGGLFAEVEPVELRPMELTLLTEVARENWSKVNPAIFGTLFEGSLGKEDRHALGAHFTSETDILKVVRPTIVEPWQARIAAANTAKELLALRSAILRYKVLDSACGSGNFLYVAYRELKYLELELLDKIYNNFGRMTQKQAGGASLVSDKQFFGIDTNGFAVELAKLTLTLAKKLVIDETAHRLETGENHLPFDFNEQPLPLDNLDANIIRADALFCEWPEADAIVGNPPYQSKNKMQKEFGPAYLHRVRERYPDVSGMADYCVYWFRRAHDELPPGGRAGLVGTKTIHQTNSRKGGLDYIDANGGTITEAVAKQVWSGTAVVHVSIVNWVKGEQPGLKKLHFQDGDRIDSPWRVVEREYISPSLSDSLDVSRRFLCKPT